MFKNVVVGGTFDRFHKGHEAFLNAAFSIGERVSLAITSGGFLERQRKRLSGAIQPYDARVGAVNTFLEKRGIDSRARVFKIDDQFGDAHTNPNYEAIVVTEETKGAALKINEHRPKAGLSKLIVVEVPLVLAEDGKPISSSRIRAGAIDAEGRVRARGGLQIGNEVRRNLAELLEVAGAAYGYDLYKRYRKNYGPVSLRLVYYHLAKGCAEGLFQVKEVKCSEGGYSWGKHAERVYYELGPAVAGANKQKVNEV